MKSRLPKLDARLSAALPFVRVGSFLADVGTDHAYLPIYLMLTEKIRGAVASDIHQGPIERAKRNLFAAGLGGKVSALCTDGLHGLEDFDPDDVLIFGMGGDLMVRILSEADWLCREGRRLILQPMTHADTVRRYLTASGWRIAEETLVREDRIYQILAADYDGVARTLTEVQAMLGTENISRGGELFVAFAEHEMQVLKKRIDGKRSAGRETGEEDALLKEITSLRDAAIRNTNLEESV